MAVTIEVSIIDKKATPGFVRLDQMALPLVSRGVTFGHICIEPDVEAGRRPVPGFAQNIKITITIKIYLRFYRSP